MNTEPLLLRCWSRLKDHKDDLFSKALIDEIQGYFYHKYADARIEENCPSCGHNFDAGSIPVETWHYYSPPFRWSSKMAIYSRELDRTIAWRCQKCGHEWERT